MRRLIVAARVAAPVLLASPAVFADTVTLPTTGVDVGSYTSALVTNLGTVAGTAIAAGFAIFAIWMGFKYVKKAIRGA
jgi:hypothetical protein